MLVVNISTTIKILGISSVITKHPFSAEELKAEVHSEKEGNAAKLFSLQSSNKSSR